VTDQPEAPTVVDEAESVLTGVNTPIPPAPRICDLNKCPEIATAVVHVNVSGYTGAPGSTLPIAICRAHMEQAQAGFIVGFAWTAVYRNQVPPQLRPEAP
jgi:hypothetical protein